MCTHLHTHTCAHIPMHTHLHMHTHAHTAAHTHLCTHTHAHTPVHAYRCAHTCAHIPMHTHLHTHTHAHTPAHTHLCTHTHACTPVHAHPCMHTHAASTSPRDSRHIATTGWEHTEAQAGSEGHPWDGPSSEETDACGQLQGLRALLMGQMKPSSSFNFKDLQTLSV